jgi:hypothetical protein
VCYSSWEKEQQNEGDNVQLKAINGNAIANLQFAAISQTRSCALCIDLMFKYSKGEFQGVSMNSMKYR